MAISLFGAQAKRASLQTFAYIPPGSLWILLPLVFPFSLLDSALIPHPRYSFFPRLCHWLPLDQDPPMTLSLDQGSLMNTFTT